MSTAAPTETAPEGTAAEEPKVIDPAEYKVLEEKLLKSEADVKDLKDKYMRALAETENVRNRMIKVRTLGSYSRKIRVLQNIKN